MSPSDWLLRECSAAQPFLLRSVPGYPRGRLSLATVIEPFAWNGPLPGKNMTPLACMGAIFQQRHGNADVTSRYFRVLCSVPGSEI